MHNSRVQQNGRVEPRDSFGLVDSGILSGVCNLDQLGNKKAPPTLTML